MNRDMRDRLVHSLVASGTYVCVPLQGSGTFAVEATIATLVPRDGKLLVLVNGAYGTRMVRSPASWGGRWRLSSGARTSRSTPRPSTTG